MRKKNIITFTSFVIVLVALLLGASEVVSGFNYHVSTLANEPENSMDYLVIGDSEAYTSVSPMLVYKDFGFTGYNLGQPRVNLQETYYQLTEALKTQSPKVVLLEVDTAFRGGKPLKNIENFVNYGIERFFSISKYHNDWKAIAQNNFKKNEADEKTISTTNYSKGFRLRKDRKPFKGKMTYMEPNSNFEEIPSYHEEYMQRIIDLCKEENITLILFSSVSPMNWNYARHNTIQKIADEQGLTYVDLNIKTQELGIDQTNQTYDGGDHVNYDAAKLISKCLGKQLDDLGILTDKKNDDDYSYWNTTLENYIKNVGE